MVFGDLALSTDMSFPVTLFAPYCDQLFRLAVLVFISAPETA